MCDGQLEKWYVEVLNLVPGEIAKWVQKHDANKGKIIYNLVLWLLFVQLAKVQMEPECSRIRLLELIMTLLGINVSSHGTL